MNNNMSNDEMLRKMFEEIKKLSNIQFSGEPARESSTAEDLIDTVSRIGVNKVKKEAAKFVKDIQESPSLKKTPVKEDIIQLLFKEYGCAGRTAEYDEVCEELTRDLSDDEKKNVCSKLKKLSEAEAKAAFLAGFEAAKELFK